MAWKRCQYLDSFSAAGDPKLEKYMYSMVVVVMAKPMAKGLLPGWFSCGNKKTHKNCIGKKRHQHPPVR